MNSVSFLLALGLANLCQPAVVHCQVTCTGQFQAISAPEFVANLVPGWNLGNSLDAFPDEDSWNNQPVVEAALDDAKAAGFKSVRVPGMQCPSSLAKIMNYN